MLECIPTSLVLLEYTTFMRGVDVAKELQVSYSSQVHSHKWRHCIFYFLFDSTTVNMYIIYLGCFNNVNQGRPRCIPMIHLEFKMELCKAFLHDWMIRNLYPLDLLLVGEQLLICTPSYSIRRKLCVIC